jgi:nicotinamide phosphoribosyltransferase
VYRDANGKLVLKQQATWDEVRNCEFVQVYCDGRMMNAPTLAEIRKRVRGGS